MQINQLYHNLEKRIMQIRPNENITRIQNLARLMLGIFQKQSVHLSKTATKIPGKAKTSSITRRLRRFLDNPAVRVREWYAPVAREWLQAMANSTGQIRLILDTTKVGFGHRLLMVSLAFRKRAIPIAWTWLKGSRGHSSTGVQLALLAYVRRLIPAGIPVLLVGDTEFESGDVQRQLEAWKWQYVLRQKPNNRVCLPGSSSWQPLGDLAAHPGESRWVEGARLTTRHARPVNLLAYWQTGEETPWLLATNLPSQRLTLQAYKRRMWVEEMFGDLKGHGFDLESTHLRNFQRLSRLTLAVALLYVWCLRMGSRLIKDGQRPQVDRSDRRDLSLFQIGVRFIDRCLTNNWHVPASFQPVL